MCDVVEMKADSANEVELLAVEIHKSNSKLVICWYLCMIRVICQKLHKWFYDDTILRF